MAKLRKSVPQLWAESEESGETHISRTILNELEEYAKMKQFYPVEHALYRYMAKPHWNHLLRKLEPARYPDLKIALFRYWFERLVEAGYIDIDNDTRAVRCVHLEIVERDGFSL